MSKVTPKKAHYHLKLHKKEILKSLKAIIGGLKIIQIFVEIFL